MLIDYICYITFSKFESFFSLIQHSTIIFLFTRTVRELLVILSIIIVILIVDFKRPKKHLLPSHIMKDLCFIPRKKREKADLTAQIYNSFKHIRIRHGNLEL
jgi:hypothetical protein